MILYLMRELSPLFTGIVNSECIFCVHFVSFVCPKRLVPSFIHVFTSQLYTKILEVNLFYKFQYVLEDYNSCDNCIRLELYLHV